MRAGRGMLEERLGRYEEQLRGLNSYVKELNDRADEHGTDRSLIEDDLREAEHNIRFYESEIAHIRQELGAGGGGHDAGGGDRILPRTAKQGVVPLALALLGLAAGAILGASLSSRGGGGRRRGED